MNIVLDIDGVLAAFYEHFANRLHRKLPMKMDACITSAEWKAIHDSDFWQTMPTLPGVEYLKRHSPLNRSIWLLTSRPESARAPTLEWLARVGIMLYNDAHLLIVKPSAEKIGHLKALAPCAFLDDYLPVVAVADGYDEIDAKLMLQPWNVAALPHFEKVRAVRSVEQFFAELPHE